MKAGVEVCIFYDDMGSIWFVSMDFAKKLESVGIKSIWNLERRRCAYGRGCGSFSDSAFLEMLNAASSIQPDEINMEQYLKPYQYHAKQNGYIQPYADSPLDGEQVGEEVYISMINKAEKYCWFITPYLIITDEMTGV